MALTSNIFDCALVFEGGGMRASYTAAVVNTLLDNGIFFDHVYGVSAGASNTVNYLSRDTWRSHASFVDLVEDPRFGGWGSFLQHKGFFNAKYIYQEAGKPGGALPFDWDTFSSNPAKLTISGFERDTGRTCYWTREDMPTLDDLTLRVRASSTLPIVMPPVKVDGRVCYDGGLGVGYGLLAEKALADGHKRLFVVRTRPRDYRKPQAHSKSVERFYWRRPYMRKAISTRNAAYNAACDLIESLEEEGRAFVFYAEDQMCENSTTDRALLQRNFEAGLAQAQRDLPRLLAFLGI